MASAFERVVKSVIRELDQRGELIPVDSLQSSTSFQPYCLLVRKPSRSWFWRHRYKCVNLSIRDILEPNAPEPAVERGGPFHFQDTVDGQVKGSVELTAPGHGRLGGGASVSGSSSASMNVCRLQVVPNTWVAMQQERRLRQPEHKILQQLRNRGVDVFVVTEVLQTQKEVEVTRTHKQEGSGQFVLPGAVGLQGQGQGHLSQRKTVTIPPGSILAFQVAQLVIGSDWDVLLFPGKKQRTFEPPQAGQRPSCEDRKPLQTLDVSSKSVSGFRIESDGSTEDGLVPTQDFQGLQKEVRAQAEGLEGLCKDLCEQLLGGLRQVLREELALQALEEALEQGLCCGRVEEPLHGPGRAILDCMVLTSGVLEKDLAGPISYLLGALAVLNETQHVLLAELLETGTLLEQFELVRSLLEQSSPWQSCRAVFLPPKLLGSSWGPEAPAWVLLEECGLGLQVGAPQVSWEPQAQGCTCALYACLAVLLRLSEPC
uniref:Gasdermin D n=1 Tax=Equus asinus TaxID=9793 RepID=A0A8C4LQX4_EQUAS|nr:gasdermin-D [Equus asinus]XP_014713658.2 gasdermin-D [Equus asinus]XP_014713659.2 gasdermin-D [Equus asinus]XP_044636956.1 gasdermin-D [Equus asinus]XP_044636957.1 gasdermin-D [Equus asinus]XP_044636958.1 gasdermin-D [Equus asinus]